jgi:hypothetical protein
MQTTESCRHGVHLGNPFLEDNAMRHESERARRADLRGHAGKYVSVLDHIYLMELRRARVYNSNTLTYRFHIVSVSR